MRTPTTETSEPRPGARRERPVWPPRPGTRCGVFLPGSLTEHRSEVVDASGSELLVLPPSGVEPANVEEGSTLKLLFPGRALPLGVEGVLTEAPRSSRGPWMLTVAGDPIAVERREHERVACRRLVVIRVDDRMIPAHMLDRSLHGMRCAAGRGVQLAIDDRIDVEVTSSEAVHGARVVWQRLGPRGLEFGLRF